MPDITPRGAIVQRDRKNYTIVPRKTVGFASPGVLDAISSVVREKTEGASMKHGFIEISEKERECLKNICW